MSGRAPKLKHSITEAEPLARQGLTMETGTDPEDQANPYVGHVRSGRATGTCS